MKALAQSCYSMNAVYPTLSLVVLGIILFPSKEEKQKQILSPEEAAYTELLMALEKNIHHSHDELANGAEGDCEVWVDTLLLCQRTAVETHSAPLSQNQGSLGRWRFGGGHGGSKKDDSL